MLALHRAVVLLLFVNPAASLKESRVDNFLPGPFRDWIRLLWFADIVKQASKKLGEKICSLGTQHIGQVDSSTTLVCSINDHLTHWAKISD